MSAFQPVQHLADKRQPEAGACRNAEVLTRPSAFDAEIDEIDADGEPDHDEREVYGRRDQRPRPELREEGKDPRTPGEEHVDAYRQ